MIRHQTAQVHVSVVMRGLAALSDVREWIFCPGMMFLDVEKWWGDSGLRLRAHEGLDLLLYADHQGKVCQLNETSPIPVLGNGVILCIIPDFLGRSIIVEHTLPKEGSGRLYSIYAHTCPGNEVRAGMAMREGDILGTVAGPHGSPFPMAPHLHVSVGWTPAPVPSGRLNWDTIADPDVLNLLDPLAVMDCRYRAEKDDVTPCRAL